MRPTIGRIVVYRSRTGYDVPAMVAATQDTLVPKGLQIFEASGGKRGCPPLDSPDHLHLVCFTPGIPGVYPESEGMPSTPAGGTFQEWNVPFFNPTLAASKPPAASWRWPERA